MRFDLHADGVKLVCGATEDRLVYSIKDRFCNRLSARMIVCLQCASGTRRDEQGRALVIGIVRKGGKAELRQPVCRALHDLAWMAEAPSDLRDGGGRCCIHRGRQDGQLHFRQSARAAGFRIERTNAPAQARNLVGESLEIGKALAHDTMMSN